MGGTLSLSPPAATYVREYLHRRGISELAVRVSAFPTHCMGGKGFGYSIGEDLAKPDDEVVESHGVMLLVDQESMRYVRGALIDYEESLQSRGLLVRNPNAIGRCHCGRHDVFEGYSGAESEVR